MPILFLEEVCSRPWIRFLVQLINLLVDKYIVWDKSATIKFKRPTKEDLYAQFTL